MKKIFFFAAAAIVAAACAKEGPQAAQVEVTAPAENGAEMAINFGTNLKATVATKAQGSVDSWDATQNLYIYGFERKKAADGSIYLDYADAKINNVLATSPAKVEEPTLTGALEVKDANGQPYYYEGNKTYDFFGYYVDDLTVTPQVAQDGILVPVVLTGADFLNFLSDERKIYYGRTYY